MATTPRALSRRVAPASARHIKASRSSEAGRPAARFQSCEAAVITVKSAGQIVLMYCNPRQAVLS
jgi:hypothetical protein